MTGDTEHHGRTPGAATALGWAFGASVRHPTHTERQAGRGSVIEMQVNRRLKSSRIDVHEISVDDALQLAERLLKAVNIVRSAS